MNRTGKIAIASIALTLLIFINSTMSLSRTGNQTLILTEVGQFTECDNVYDVQVIGNIAFVGDFNLETKTGTLRMVDVTDPANPRSLGNYSNGMVHDLVIVDEHAFVTDGKNLEIIDISNHSNPIQVGTSPVYVGGSSGFDSLRIQIIDKLAYIAAGEYGLVILNVSDLTNPSLISQFDDGGEINGLNVAGSKAYLADLTHGIEILDISDPENPVKLGQNNIAEDAWRILVIGNLAYVSCAENGLFIFDVSDPANPVLNGSYTDHTSLNIQVVGDRGFVAGIEDGLLVLDVSDPTNPVLLGQYDDGGTSLNVHVVNDMIYVADQVDGMEIIRITEDNDISTSDTATTPGFELPLVFLGLVSVLTCKMKKLRKCLPIRRSISIGKVSGKKVNFCENHL
ncbi:MAG: LVIVD repeat-containing protein [Candidatus Hodarchaeales archaeon]